MAKLSQRNLNQTAVLWEASGVDQYNRATVEAPVEIQLRLEEVEGVTLDADNTKVEYDAIAKVKQDIPVKSILALGTLDAVPTSDFKQVVKQVTIPNVKGTDTYREVLLINYSDSLPALS